MGRWPMARKGRGARTGTFRRDLGKTHSTPANGGEQAQAARGADAPPQKETATAPLMPRLSDENAKAGAELLRALADPTRLQILDVLRSGGGDISVRELEGAVGLPDPRTGQRPRQPTISHHLKILRMAGLVGFRRRGPWIHYYVCSERVSAARALLDMLR